MFGSTEFNKNGKHMALIPKLVSFASRIRRSYYGYRLQKKYRNNTMIARNTYIKNIVLAHEAMAISGCVVECGVWRGGMSAGLAEVLSNHRKYFLFDSFEGLPPAEAIDGPSAIAWQQNKEGATYHNNCMAEIHYAADAMKKAGVMDTNVTFIQGWFEKTLPSWVPPEPIALLRLDADWYSSTMTCLENLYKHMQPGGLVILDDYHTWDGCAKAVHDFISKEKLPVRIREWMGEVCWFRVPV